MDSDLLDSNFVVTSKYDYLRESLFEAVSRTRRGTTSLQLTKYRDFLRILSPLGLPISPSGLSAYAGSVELNGIKWSYSVLGAPLKLPLKLFPRRNAADSICTALSCNNPLANNLLHTAP